MPSRRPYPAFILALIAAACLAATNALAVPAGTAFTYQGKIDRSGSPANGPYDIEFSLWDAVSGGSQIGVTQTINGVPVTNGLFTVSLDFGGVAFDGSARWLEISLQGPGDLGFTPLSPRQAMTVTPYAIRALSGGSGFALPFTGTVAAPSASAIEVENTGAGGYGITARGKSWGGWFQSTEGGTLGSGLIAYGGSEGVWASGGNAGVYGESFTGFGVDGFYGFGTFLPAGDKAGVYGHTTSTNSVAAGVRGEATVARGVEGISGTGTGVHGRSSTTFGVYGTVTAGSGGAGVFGQTSLNNTAGVLGRNESAGPDAQAIYGYASSGAIGVLGISEGNDAIVGRSNAPNKSGIFAYSTHANGVGGAFTNTGGGTALSVTGLAQVTTLQIMGGADLAERFAARETAEPGTVMAIDPDAPGHMQVADEPYCHRVAGVVSGARDLKAGVVLSEDGITEGTLPIALTGRVWVKCDATRAPIRPGDLLTTSGRAGHAMAATDMRRATGAILGKAMTSLERGTGMVLVLVSLQ
jgi:hypothetical protein